MRRLLALLVASLLLPLSGSGQSLRDRVSGLFTFGSCGEPLCLDVSAGNTHGEHFVPSVVQGENNMLAFLTGAIGRSIGDLPFTAASSGVIYTLQGGVPVGTPTSAGPIFAERAQTLGKGRFFVSASLNGIKFDNIRGVPMDDLRFTFTHQDVDPVGSLGAPFLESDLIEVTTDLQLRLLVTSFVLGFGVTDRLDVGVALPMMRASVKGTSFAEIRPIDFDSTTHRFGTALTATSRQEGSAVGIGDVTIRLKANAGSNFAVVGDVRVPTGAEEDFLGTGATTVRVLAVLSGREGGFTPHVNAGYLYNDAASQNNRILLTAGFDHLMTERVTIAAELSGSFETADSPLRLPTPVHFDLPAPRTVQLTQVPDRKDNFLDASLGVKYANSSGLRFIGNVLLPIARAGMRAPLLWAVGVERVF